MTDGTDAGTELLVPSSAFSTEEGTRHITQIVPTDEGVFFTAALPGCVPIGFPMPFVPEPLWGTNTRGETRIILDGIAVKTVSLAGKRLFFAEQAPDESYRLWTVPVGSTEPDELGLFEFIASSVATDNGGLFFYAGDDVGNDGIWFSDGSVAGPSFISPYSPFVAVGNRAYFVRAGGLWTSDGTVEGLRPVPGAPPAAAGSYYQSMIEWGGKAAIFHEPSAFDHPNAFDLWTTDGTAEGTHRLATFQDDSIYPGDRYLVLGDVLYFIVGANALWKSDGTTSGTMAIANVGGYVSVLAPLGRTLVAITTDGEARQLIENRLAPMPMPPREKAVAVAAMPTKLFYAAEPYTQPLLTLRSWCCGN